MSGKLSKIRHYTLPLVLAAVLAVCGACAYERTNPDINGLTAATPGVEHSLPDVRSHTDVAVADLEPEVQAPGIPSPIRLDGDFTDWDEIPLAYLDASGDAGSTGLDITTVKVTNDDRYLYLMVELGTEISLDEGHYLTLYLDTDANPETGKEAFGLGAELEWIWGQRWGFFFSPFGLHEVWFTDLGFRAEPTVTSPRFEMAFRLDSKPDNMNDLFKGDSIRLAIVDNTWNADGDNDGDLAPGEGDVIEVVLDRDRVAQDVAISLERGSAVAVRVVTHNMLWDGMLDPERKVRFERIYKALAPDIINFQECTEEAVVIDAIEDWLPLQDGEWQYVAWSDRLTLSRFPIVGDWPATYEPLDYRFTVVPVQVSEDQRLIIFNAHLSFGDQDAGRQVEADSFIAYVRDLTTEGGEVELDTDTPFVLLGDLNLVGDAQQLLTLTTGEIINKATFGESHHPDWDDSNLADLISLQTGNPMAYTWRSDGGGFWPGRLDFFIYTDSVMTVVKSFTLNTLTMSDEELAEYGLDRNDTHKASDHLPVVVDVEL